MQYDHDDNFPEDFEPDGIPFGIFPTKKNYDQDHISLNMTGN